jgi:CheY-like chemotaxis protein
LREILVTIIELMGFTTVTSKNAKEGVEKALAEKPNLILMDIMMPEISGWEATQRIRGRPDTKDIPILASTALSRSCDLQRCIDVGCNDYIVKPAKKLRRKLNPLI